MGISGSKATTDLISCPLQMQLIPKKLRDLHMGLMEYKGVHWRQVRALNALLCF